MKFTLNPNRLPVKRARKRAFDLYFAEAKRGYAAAWKLVTAHLPATVKCGGDPYVATYLAARHETGIALHIGRRSLSRAIFNEEMSLALLRKAGTGAGSLTDPLVQQKIKEAIESAFTLGATKAAGAISDGEATWFAAEGIKYTPADAEALLAAYTKEFDAKVGGFKTCADNVTESVLGKVHEFYTEPGSVHDLTEALRPDFSPYNAERVANTETTRMASTSTRGIMRSFGQTKWIWRANGANPCEICEGNDGQEFDVSDPMPPDASHVNCACQAEAEIDTENEALDVGA